MKLGIAISTYSVSILVSDICQPRISYLVLLFEFLVAFLALDQHQLRRYFYFATTYSALFIACSQCQAWCWFAWRRLNAELLYDCINTKNVNSQHNQKIVHTLKRSCNGVIFRGELGTFLFVCGEPKSMSSSETASSMPNRWTSFLPSRNVFFIVT